MPIINGMKMACEPCIRGHRSTKCTHAKERLMVPVRKPGRPLSVCPHPPGKVCGCSGITAAIPRAQKCGCGSDSNAAGPSMTNTPIDNSAVSGSASPTRRSFQIQKPSAPRINSRKQSFDVSKIERMDTESYNILPAPPYRSSFSSIRTVSSSNGDSLMSPLTSQSSIEYLVSLPESYERTTVAYDNGIEFPLPSQLDDREALSSPPITAETPRPRGNGASYFSEAHSRSNGTESNSTPLARNGIETMKSAVPAGAPGSCCGGKAVPKTQTNGNGHLQSPPLTNGSSHNLGSFHPPQIGANGEAANGRPGVNPIMTAFDPVPQPMYFAAQSADPTIYTYPPFYGTCQHPIQPAQWRQAMMGYGMQHSGAPHIGGPAQGIHYGVSNPAVPHYASMSHQCTCGDACNCLGCPAHPYNDRTQEYVRSAMNSMSEARNGSGEQPVSSGQHQQLPRIGSEKASPTTATAPVQSSCCAPAPTVVAGAESSTASHPSSPPQARTPSEASVGSEDQAQLSANDFLFVTYPFGCEGEMASCLCGDDCQCVGCLIHGT